jgi:hypothetical protein
MRRLFIADCHAALPALEAVIRHAGDVDEVYFLGDAVDCGPHPGECLDLLRDIGAVCLMGNHDRGVVDLPVGDGRDAPTVWWTWAVLSDDQRAFLATFEEGRRIVSCGQDTILIHCIPYTPYLTVDDDAESLSHHFHGIRARNVYCGHSHVAVDIETGMNRYVCLRPVVNARDGDSRASYSIEEDGVLRHVYVEYDNVSIKCEMDAVKKSDLYRGIGEHLESNRYSAPFPADFHA